MSKMLKECSEILIETDCIVLTMMKRGAKRLDSSYGSYDEHFEKGALMPCTSSRSPAPFVLTAQPSLHVVIGTFEVSTDKSIVS